MKLKLTTGRVGDSFVQLPGDELQVVAQPHGPAQVDPAEAERMVAGGLAEYVEAATRPPAENAAARTESPGRKERTQRPTGKPAGRGSNK